MSHTTIEFRPSKAERAMKPVLGALAMLATAATLGLMVVGPAALSPAGEAYVVARTALPAGTERAAPAPVEVAIVPSCINVVATRAKVARADHGRFVPATYRTR